MSRDIVVADATPITLGVDLNRLYRRCVATPAVPVPTFIELYEEYVALYLEAKMDVTKKDIELALLKAEYGSDVFDVENGFLPSAHGISPEFLLLDALMSNQLFFSMDGKLYNQPVVEVW